jgi:hypothetical protein
MLTALRISLRALERSVKDSGKRAAGTLENSRAFAALARRRVVRSTRTLVRFRST